MASGFENEIIEKGIPLADPVTTEGAAGKRSGFCFTCFLKYNREYSFCNLFDDRYLDRFEYDMNDCVTIEYIGYTISSDVIGDIKATMSLNVRSKSIIYTAT